MLNEFAMPITKVICGISLVLAGAGVLSHESMLALVMVLQVAWLQAGELEDKYNNSLWKGYHKEFGEENGYEG